MLSSKVRVTDEKALAQAYPNLMIDVPCRHCEGTGKVRKRNRALLNPLARSMHAAGGSIPGVEVIICDEEQKNEIDHEAAAAVAQWGKDKK